MSKRSLLCPFNKIGEDFCSIFFVFSLLSPVISLINKSHTCHCVCYRFSSCLTKKHLAQCVSVSQPRHDKQLRNNTVMDFVCPLQAGGWSEAQWQREQQTADKWHMETKQQRTLGRFSVSAYFSMISLHQIKTLQLPFKKKLVSLIE